MRTFLFKLYTTGKTPHSERAIVNLRRILETELEGDYELLVYDALEQPRICEEDKILATPTLVKELPPPARWVIGDLSDAEKVFLGLDLPGNPSRSLPGD